MRFMPVAESILFQWVFVIRTKLNLKVGLLLWNWMVDFGLKLIANPHTQSDSVYPIYESTSK